MTNRAFDLRATSCESVRTYSGSRVYYGEAPAERRKEIFLAGKCRDRTKAGTLVPLHDTVRNMRADHLKL